MALDTVTPRSRRALLGGAAGALVAFVAQALGRPLSARGADGDNMILGAVNTATATTKISNTATTDAVFWGAAAGGVGVQGTSDSSTGVYGLSDSWAGVAGVSLSLVGVVGRSASAEWPAIVGQSYGDNTGLLGYSGSATITAAPAKTGVYGYAAQDGGSRGVWRRANAGRGVYGQATSGYGVYGTAASGTAAYFKGGDGSGRALNAQGRVFFRTAGLATIGAGSSTAAPSPPGSTWWRPPRSSPLWRGTRAPASPSTASPRAPRRTRSPST